MTREKLESIGIFYHRQTKNSTLDLWDYMIDHYTKETYEGITYFIIEEPYYWKVKDKNYKFFTLKTKDSNNNEVKIIPTSEWLRLTNTLPCEEGWKDSGVYGIYYKEKIIYIGKTSQTFYERFSQHYGEILHSSENQYLYRFTKHHNINPSELVFKPLFSIQKAKIYNIDILMSNMVLSWIEAAFITYFQPVANEEGVTKDYLFRDRDWVEFMTAQEDSVRKDLQRNINIAINTFFDELHQNQS